MVALILVSAFGLGAVALSGIALLGLYPLLPADLGGAPDLDSEAERVRIRFGDRDGIDGWWLRGRLPAIVLVLHGYGRNHTRAWRYGAFLNAAGYHILAIDFRSSSHRNRKPTTLGHFELDDAREALRWIHEQQALAGFKIAVFGESLGGAVALLAAASDPSVAALVVDCPFASGRLALEESCERWAGLPRRPTADIVRGVLRGATGRDPAEIDPLSAMARLESRPVFFIHGDRDDRLSPDQTRRLWKAAGAKDPLWIIGDAGHNQGWAKHRGEYERRVSEFFARHLLGEGAGPEAER